MKYCLYNRQANELAISLLVPVFLLHDILLALAGCLLGTGVGGASAMFMLLGPPYMGGNAESC